jgi:hypothetical protein
MQIDPTAYVQTPRFSVSAGLALVRALIASVPTDAAAALRASAQTMRDQGVRLQDAWIATDSKPAIPDARPVDAATDAIWRGVHMSAQGAVTSRTSEAKAAAGQKVLDELYAEGLTFINIRYPLQWSEMEKRLEKLKDPELSAALTLVTDDNTLPALQRQQAAYGKAIGVTERAPEPATPSPNLTDERAALSDKITLYCIAVLAAYPIDDEAGAAKVRHILGPIDELRAAAKANRTPKEEPPEDPIPPVAGAGS